jgi:hypothetical protein
MEEATMTWNTTDDALELCCPECGSTERLSSLETLRGACHGQFTRQPGTNGADFEGNDTTVVDWNTSETSGVECDCGWSCSDDDWEQQLLPVADFNRRQAAERFGVAFEEGPEASLVLALAAIDDGFALAVAGIRWAEVVAHYRAYRGATPGVLIDLTNRNHAAVVLERMPDGQPLPIELCEEVNLTEHDCLETIRAILEAGPSGRQLRKAQEVADHG